MGRPVQSPFAQSLEEVLSSSAVKVLWRFFNIAADYDLVFRVGDFGVRNTGNALACGDGMLLIAHFFA